ncbi:MAG: N-acetylmuramoyl-L-alanine amidase [Alphaproteobacteria bacterium]
MASPNHGARRSGPTDILLMHYTAMESAPAACAWLCDPASQVSAHYLVDEAGTVFALVGEDRRAWHAGAAWWHGETDINSRSIGIEIANCGPQSARPNFPDKQIDVVIALAQDILARHPIAPSRVLAHSDVAPGRKIDPGPFFPWGHLAAQGVGLMPQGGEAQGATLLPGDNGDAVGELRRRLAAVGYDLAIANEYDDETARVVGAFQLHYRPACCDGVADAETRALLGELLRLTDRPGLADRPGLGNPA